MYENDSVLKQSEPESNQIDKSSSVLGSMMIFTAGNWLIQS